MSNGFTCIDAFSGAGGLALGLETAGFEIVAAFDADRWAVETFQRNVSGRAFIARVEDLDGRELLEQTGTTELDLLAGGPPCQGFSKQKRGAHLGDVRNALVLEFIRLVREISPKFFLLENVDQLGQKRGKSFVAHLQDQLSDYLLFPTFFNCADYGLAQTRQRFVIVGKRNTIAAMWAPPKPTVTKWRTVGEALLGLPEPPKDYQEHAAYANHYRARVTAINIKRFSYVPQGGGWSAIPEHLRLACHKKVDTKSGGWPDVYGRLKYDGQAPTITGGFDSFTRGRYGHPIEDRPLTPREAARLQGFPDCFRFFGTRGDVRGQIGNAVPPPLGAAIGESIIRTLRSDAGDPNLATVVQPATQIALPLRVM